MGWRLNATVGAAIITVAGTVGTAFINGWFGMHKTDDKPQSTQSCAFPAVRLDAPSQVGGTFETTAKLMCPPPTGTKYYLISQMDGVGKKGTEHPVYCPRDPIGPEAEKKTYTSERDVHTSPVGSTRSLYYLTVNDDQEQKLLANLHGDCAWSLPAGAGKVSNTVEVERGWQ
ncbi:hypothetical protein AV521_42830 [Streptomyces sp. IMTB 2501]|uniref:hypothetical protein n=1 Tax=Streptomyces sp. IMTB 2501 TaxID=1776340 RepID=UPI00096FAE54|nr:hypothetical protein [Streptomyces sp. IMTB 2501]OLZ62152.1 hypothetical protein AV521_42830 [Streptomyces sp. IMTB 2501]